MNGYRLVDNTDRIMIDGVVTDIILYGKQFYTIRKDKFGCGYSKLSCHTFNNDLTLLDKGVKFRTNGHNYETVQKGRNCHKHCILCGK